MHKFDRYRKLGLVDFNQPLGFKMNYENRWVKAFRNLPLEDHEKMQRQINIQST